MRQVGLETVAALQLFRERLQDLQRHLGIGATATAHHVVMEGRIGALILGHAIVEMRVPHHAEILEHLQRAIDGRDVDIRKHAHDLLMDRIGCEMAVRLHHDVQDQLALGRHAQAALPERDFELGGLDQEPTPPAAPYHSRMSTSPGEESDEAPEKGEILKASAPAAQVQVGMEVSTFDGERIGTVKKIRADEFQLHRHMARDLWVPFSAVMAAEDYSGNYHGPVQPTMIVLNVSAAHVDRQGWRHA